jgi:molecular chaperone GrpE (heat shock protein)
VNGSQNQIVLVLSEHEAAAAARRNQLGYTVHDRVCRKSAVSDA